MQLCTDYFCLSLLFICVDTDKPTDKLLNSYVKNKVAPNWYNLGVQLLNTEHLDGIKWDYPANTSKCCTKMFEDWLKVDIEASWNKLIAALEETDQYVLAESIRSDVLKHFEFIGMCVYSVCLHVSMGKYVAVVDPGILERGFR